MGKGFILGILATIVVGLAAAYVGITQGLLIPANADAQPSKLERWAASRSLDATIRREMPADPNPIPVTQVNYLAGIKLYGENCSVCHGVPGERPSVIAIGLYQHAPQLARHGVEDDPDAETFWKIKHGIRLTGMPAYTRTLSDEQIWTLALFLKHMDKLPALPERAWKALRVPVALAPLSALPSPQPGSSSTR
ncbi:MAG TPA: cytochrome c [Candidatus Acidoferrales bacterium]|nr:cytochrome c [Candidatus Acidoferrales bacterium]